MNSQKILQNRIKINAKFGNIDKLIEIIVKSLDE